MMAREAVVAKSSERPSGQAREDDLNLSGLDGRAASEYVYGFIKALKETQRQRKGA